MAGGFELEQVAVLIGIRSIARIEQAKEATARDSAARLDAMSGELNRMQQRAEANERRLLEEVDRARQEFKSAQKRASEVNRRLNEVRAENENQQTLLEAQIRGLQVQRATLLERVAASERRFVDLQAWLDEVVVSSMRMRVSRRIRKTGGRAGLGLRR